MSTSIFAIRCKATGEFQIYNGRCAWTKSGNAENAWNKFAGPYHYEHTRHCEFANQSEYEIVDLVETYYRMEGLDV